MANDKTEGFEAITEEEVNALSEMLDGILTTWERGADEREDEQIGLVTSLLEKLEDISQPARVA